MPPSRRAALLALAAPALLAAPTLLAARRAAAQPAGPPGWAPDRPVRVIVPFTPGGTIDVVVRVVQPVMAAELGQPLVLENRPGGSTIVGTQELIRSPADGHAMLMIANSFAANVTLRRSLPYDSFRDLAPVVQATVVPHVLVVHPELARDFAGFAAAGRRPGAGLSFGSYGIGTSNHLGAEQLSRAAGLNTTHVPYNGGPQAQTDLIGGRIQFMFANLPDVLQPVQLGQMRAVALSAEARARELPDVPTMRELGFPLVLSDSWFGAMLRAGTPPAARERLERAWLAALARPEVKGRLEELGFAVLARPGAAFGAEIRRYADTYAGVIRDAGIRVE